MTPHLPNWTIEERNRILREFDVDAAHKMMPYLSREGVIVGMHKSRMHVAHISKELRLESVEWLRARGFSDLHGLPLPPPGVLPPCMGD